MRSVILLFLGFFVFTGCDAQEKKKSTIKEDTIEQQPKVEWNVNKELDEHGNIIRYDSTYTWSYSSGGKDLNANLDSVMTQFRKEFDQHFPTFFDRNFGDRILNDSLLFRDFNKPDYFKDRWNRHFFDMEQMIIEMDSLREQFLRNRYPGLLAPEKEATKETEL